MVQDTLAESCHNGVMIRRPWTIAGPAGWALIRQTDHAMLAGQLARLWQAACAQRGSPPGGDWEIVLAAIDRHDDGWQAWDDLPLVDAADGRPSNFLEVPDEIATQIWRRSIEGVADLGPLAQYLVAGHFLNLRRHSVHEQTPPARQFMAEFEPQSARWLSQWSHSAENRRPEMAQAALELLQRFDYCSLWLCEAIEPAERTVDLPGGPTLQWAPPTPDADPGQLAEKRIMVRPWSLAESTIRWSVPARCVAAQRYSSSAALLEACSPIQLHWRLQEA